MTGATRNIHGQTRINSGRSTLHSAYDQAGRLATVFDVSASNQCTIRQYVLDANSNRTSLKTWNPLAGGACDFTGGPASSTAASTYDSGDRLTNSGVVYDQLGRTTTLPAASAGGQALTASYYVNDLVASMSQGGTTYTYELDPARRFLARGTTGSITNHYGDDSDSPTWTATNPSGSQYARPVAGLDGQVAAIYDSTAGTATMQYANLHGDLMATGTASPTLAPTSPLTKQDFDEYGVPKTAVNRYGWLGQHERSTEFQAGTSLMGVRVYQPQIGRFLQVDPVLDGSAYAYDYANQDPLNQLDLDGRFAFAIPVGIGIRVVGGAVVKKAGSVIGKGIGRPSTRRTRAHPISPSIRKAKRASSKFTLTRSGTSQTGFHGTRNDLGNFTPDPSGLCSDSPGGRGRTRRARYRACRRRRTGTRGARTALRG